MNHSHAMLRESVSRVLARRQARDTLGAEACGIDAETWEQLRRIGVVGSDAGDMDLQMHAAVLRETGYAAALVPYANSEMLGRWLARGAGLATSDEVLTVCVLADGAASRSGGRVTVAPARQRIAWARHAKRVLFAFREGGCDHVATVPASLIEWRRSSNMASEPHDLVLAGNLTLDAHSTREVTPEFGPQAVLARGALCRAIQMEGAMARANELTLQYARDRKQFSRSLAHYQIIQSYLAAMAGEQCATNAAIQRCIADGGTNRDAIAAAKIRAGQAARVITAHAHQVHGAIGFTREYPLQLWTRRLWSWREEFGNESHWARELGAAVISRGADSLWPSLTSPLMSA